MRRQKQESRLTIDPEQMCICTESFRPQPVSREISKGQWLRYSNPLVAANPQLFAIPLSAIQEVNEHGEEDR